MAYLPGQQCSAYFEKDKLVWEQNGQRRDIPWSEIRLVTEGNQGATVYFGDDSVLVSSTIVWYEFTVEDIIQKACQANPRYEGPVPTPKPRELRVPQGNDEQVVYTRAAQRFYRNRCPSRSEFKAFLEANMNWVFDESCYYECSMSMCSGSPVGEGYSTDLVIPASEKWYGEFEKLARTGKYRGCQLLDILNGIRL
jgi:hypothetical protein